MHVHCAPPVACLWRQVTRVKAAEAEADAKILQGQGIARQRQAILGGLRDSVNNFQGVHEAAGVSGVIASIATWPYCPCRPCTRPSWQRLLAC